MWVREVVAGGRFSLAWRRSGGLRSAARLWAHVQDKRRITAHHGKSGTDGGKPHRENRERYDEMGTGRLAAAPATRTRRTAEHSPFAATGRASSGGSAHRAG